jgi:hypothetical protein
VTPGRAALGTLLRWGYYAVGLLAVCPLAGSVAASATGTRGTVGLWVALGGECACVLIGVGVEAWFGRRMADRVYGLFAALARDWGVLSWRIPADGTEAER